MERLAGLLASRFRFRAAAPDVLHLDFETFSHLDVRVVGAYRYAADPSTEILVVAWALGDGPVQHWTCEDPEPPLELLALIASGVTIAAHNAQFERAILEMAHRRLSWPKTRVEQFRCTAAKAAVMSLPRSLDKVAKLFDVAEKKDNRGKALLRRFAGLQKRKNKEPFRIFPMEDPEGFAELVEYCRQDVEAERAVDREMPDLDPVELATFWMDFHVNEEGLPVDETAMRGAIRIASALGEALTEKATALTGGIAVTQRDATLAHLQERGVDIDNLQRGSLEKALAEDGDSFDDDTRDLLETRMELSRAAPKKLISMQSLLVDGRLRGTLLYHGAHTGRWTGKLFQPQNLNRGDLSADELADAFTMFVLGADPADFAARFSAGPFGAIASCIRGFIAAPEGEMLAVVDYTAIEARVLVWLAGQADKVAAYHQGLDLYRVMASRLYNVPIAQVTDEQRRIGKNLILGCGYGLGWRSFIDYCAKSGVTINDKFSRSAVGAYREEHPAVVKLWDSTEATFRQVLRTGLPATIPGIPVEVRMEMFGDFLVIVLPSGRRLYYPQPHIALKPGFGGGPPQETLAYMGQVKSSWGSIWTYGGKLVENIVQAIARDIMVMGMLRARAAGFRLILTVHDEVVSLCRDVGKGGEADLTRFSRLLSRPPAWAAGCPVSAKGFLTKRYRKD
jgi:DNA polymerase